MLADVVLPSRRFQVFTYHIPKPLQDQAFVGSPVLIPLGPSVVSGVIVRILEHAALPSLRSSNQAVTIRDILSVDASPDQSSLDQRLLMLVERIADYYLAPLAACLRLVIPPRVFKVTKRLLLTEAGREALNDASLPVDSRSVLQQLARSSQGVLRSSLIRLVPQAVILVTKLKRKGWIEERSTLPARLKVNAQRENSPPIESRSNSSFSGMGDLFEQDRNCSSDVSFTKPVLSKKMEVRAENLIQESGTGKFTKQVVIGNAHDRLQIFQHIAQSLIHQGKTVLLLVPEVHQIEAVVKQLRGIIDGEMEVYHGKLSAPARSNCWERIRQGQVHVVVGTRSALFVPLSDLALIWVDQEEDASFKDEHLPYYHARDVAGMRGAIEQALVVYGSFCPSLETYAEFREKIQEQWPASRQQLPVMTLVDLRKEVSKTLLSSTLVDRLSQVLLEGHQAIILLNRKGFSQSLICRDCGHSPSCETCGVTLRLFQRPSRLWCSYCGKSSPTPETCSLCLGTVFRFSGGGTQRLEEELSELFPSHPIFRFDRDQVKTTDEALNVLREFRQGKIQILIGTEFLFHQSELPSANFVAFPQADLGLHLQDFRSAEGTFFHLSKARQLVQSAPQGEGPSGEIFLQTRMPDHHVFQAMVRQDPLFFYQQELELREALAYPPTTHMLLLVVTGEQEVRVQRVVDFIDQQMKEVGLYESFPKEEHGKLEMPLVLGPMSSKKPGRLKKNRTIFLIKTFSLEETQRSLRKIQQAYDREFGREPVLFEVHVNPLEIQ